MLDRQCTWLKAPSGAWVDGQPDCDRDVYFVLTGRVKAALHGERRDLSFTDIEAGSFFGELGALEGDRGLLAVFAIADSILAKMPCAIFLQTMFNHRPLGEAVVAKLVSRNRAMTRKVAEAARTYENHVPSADPASCRTAQSRYDALDNVRQIGPNRRARQW
jgi:CRP/FNR family transcriptional regulator, cyclic AMP receptor protein